MSVNLDDGSAVIDMLELYLRNYADAGGFVLQQRIFGVEIGVAHYFNGHRCVAPAVVLHAQPIAHLIHQAGWRHGSSGGCDTVRMYRCLFRLTLVDAVENSRSGA